MTKLTLAIAANILVACILAASPSESSAQFKGSGFSVALEQDLFTEKNEDRNYTMGLGISVSGKLAERDWVEGVMFNLDRPIRWAFDSDIDSPSIGHGLTLSFTAFTPDSLNTPNPIVGDRPYAFLAAGSIYKTAPSHDNKSVWKSEFTLGWLGLDWGETVQTKIHVWRRKKTNSERPYDPEGWSNQIGKAGIPLPIVRYGAAYQYLPLDLSLRHEKLRFQSSVGSGAHIGYYSEINTLTTFRFGLIKSPFWQFDGSPLSGVNKGSGDPSISRSKNGMKPSFEIFLYASYTGRAVAYNTLLQGRMLCTVAKISSFCDTYTLKGRDLERLGYEHTRGLAFRLRTKSISLTGYWSGNGIFKTYRTTDVKGEFARRHYWGGGFISFGYHL